MKITAISDMHGELPALPGGDLLIVAGDCVASGMMKQWMVFFDWFRAQPYDKKILVGGNHDNILAHTAPTEDVKKLGIHEEEGFEYLLDTGTTYEGLRIWGTPWSLWFKGINPHCKYFTGSESDLQKKHAQIPDDIDILISHGPAYGIHDSIERKTIYGQHIEFDGGPAVEFTGSKSLLRTLDRVQPKMLITGHIHGHGGKHTSYKCLGKDVQCFSTSYMDEDYEPTNKIFDDITYDTTRHKITVTERPRERV